MSQLDLTPNVCSHGASAQGATSRIKNQVAWYRDVGLLTGVKSKPSEALVSSRDPSNELAARARSYLAANCAHCHQKGAGGTATIDLRYEAGHAAMKTIGAVPVQGTFQIAEASIVSPGAPWKSVLLYRTACSGRGRMPHIGSELVDTTGVNLLRAWVESLSVPDAKTSPIASLTSTSAAIELMAMLDRNEVASTERNKLLLQARQAAPEIRNLLARFQPLKYRQQLNRSLDPSTLLALTGDAAAGGKLFGDKRIQCINCHRIGQIGGQIGPALDDVGRRLKRPEILASILEPSKKIDPKFATWTVLTTDGKIHSGLMIDRSQEVTVLRTPKNENITIPREDLEELFQQPTSLMPDRLLNDLSDQQIADLLSYLAVQKK